LKSRRQTRRRRCANGGIRTHTKKMLMTRSK
uniref:50S ribosomal protein L34 n=1 Tax=Anisakis simplex TaxID=6269 RepID=A0A0M3JL82_ANISI